MTTTPAPSAGAAGVLVLPGPSTTTPASGAEAADGAVWRRDFFPGEVR